MTEYVENIIVFTYKTIGILLVIVAFLSFIGIGVLSGNLLNSLF